ncbi:MAG: AAA family ATPase [Oscillospiraceae bacterium]
MTARKSNMILFFDEADALLGKRSSRSRHARTNTHNTEVAYLLQRMEEYSGVVLMATNLAANIDSAFVRRFRYHVSFTLPDRALRLRLWRAALPDTYPQKGIQFDYLAGRFELPGSPDRKISRSTPVTRAADDGAQF